MSEMAADWQGRLVNIFKAFDWNNFFEEAEKHFKQMPKKTYEEFKELRGNLAEFLSEKALNLERAYQCFAVLMLLMIFINLVFPDNAFAKGYYGSHHNAGDNYQTQQTFIMPVPVSPFSQSAFHANDLSTFIPDIKGNPHIRGRTRFKAPQASGEKKDEALFYALSDDIILTKTGKPYLVFEETPYAMRLEPEKFVLVESENNYPLFEFYPDAETIQSLRTNIELQLKAVDKAIADYSKWLAWTAPARYFDKNNNDESRELNNVKAIQSALSQLSLKSYIYKALPEKEPSSFKLGPGVYITKEGSILFRRADGNVVNYPYREFTNTTSFSSIGTSDKLDGFVRALLRKTALKLPPSNVLRLIIENKMPLNELRKNE
ncbi:MAG: hypothetical protein PHP17_04215, partial [Candidatus Omnitrophica bacterium]|nr:hypothetical protein [Candidatus Omnitrophota bacterium]